MKVVIVDSDSENIAKLEKFIASFNKDIAILSVFRTCKEAVAGFPKLTNFQFVIIGTHLSDGVASKVFDILNIKAPVIYIGKESDYLFKAFSSDNAIAFLPPSFDKILLHKAIDKIFYFQEHFRLAAANSIDVGSKEIKVNPGKKRFIAKRGADHFSIPQEEIILFYADSRIVYLLTKDSQKFITEYNYLSDISNSVDSSIFYRVNRNYIINLYYLRKFKTIEKARLLVEMSIPLSTQLIVSQENATEFRNWITQAI